MADNKDKSNFYFDGVTEQAILDFVECNDDQEKNIIYRDHIKPSFESLVDGLIYSYKFKSLYGHSDLKNDCVTFLYESMEKFDPSKGSKAFSYFNVIAKHYLIGKSVSFSKKMKREIKYIDKSSTDDDMRKENFSQEVKDSPEKEILEKEFFYVLLEEMLNWKGKYFHKEVEIQTIDAIIALMKNVKNLNLKNKKAVYMYLREMTGLNSKQLMMNLNKLKKKYRFTKRMYFDNFFFGFSVSGSHLSGSFG